MQVKQLIQIQYIYLVLIFIIVHTVRTYLNHSLALPFVHVHVRLDHQWTILAHPVTAVHALHRPHFSLAAVEFAPAEFIQVGVVVLVRGQGWHVVQQFGCFVLAREGVIMRAALAHDVAFGPDGYYLVSLVAVVRAACADGHFCALAVFHLACLADKDFLLVHGFVQGAVNCAETDP